MRVHEHPAESSVGHELVGATPHRSARRSGPRIPRAPGTVGAFGQPAAAGRPAKEAFVLVEAHFELQLDALVPRQQRQETVGRRRAHQLDPPRFLQLPERTHYVAVNRAPQRAEPGDPVLPERGYRLQFAVTRRVERARGFGASGEPLVEVILHLRLEDGRRKLVGQDGRHADGHRGGNAIGPEGAEHFQQWQVGIERALGDPVAAVRPAAVVQHVGQVTVQCQDEVHVTQAPAWCASARR